MMLCNALGRANENRLILPQLGRFQMACVNQSAYICGHFQETTN